MWAALFITLPTQPNAVRLRIWRGLKALGCAALRDGTYLLPADQATAFDALAAEARAHGGTATVLALAPRSEQQQAEVLALFDRSVAYGEWRTTTQALARELPRLSEPDARKHLRGVADALEALRQTDHYPGAASAQARNELDALRQAFDARFAKGEPKPRPPRGIPRLDARRFRNRRWATRARPWVDRLASGWLIRRFIDPGANFVWLAEGQAAPRQAIGFDYDGARFSHVGARVTFEVLLHSFALEAVPALQRLAAAVHCLDVGGMPVPEASGLEQVLAGLRELHADDDALLQAAGAVFDALYAAPVSSTVSTAGVTSS